MVNLALNISKQLLFRATEMELDAIPHENTAQNNVRMGHLTVITPNTLLSRGDRIQSHHKNSDYYDSSEKNKTAILEK